MKSTERRPYRMTSRAEAANATAERILDAVTELFWERPTDQVVLRDLHTDATQRVATTALFVLIGAAPHTDWLQGEIALDEKGFVLTGPAADRHDGMFETRRHGVFAVGDVRSGSVKRVASAVGEGSMSVRMVHEHLTH